MNVEINVQHLKALLPLAADKKDSRYYLKGVCLDITPDKITYVATDGHVLGMLEEPATTDYTEQVLIPTDFIKDIKLLKHPVLGRLASVEGHMRFSLSYGECTYEFSAIDGTYPDYRKVVPTSFSGEVGNYDFDLLYRFSKVNKSITNASKPGMVRLQQNGEGPAGVVFPALDNFTGIVMPFRI